MDTTGAVQLVINDKISAKILLRTMKDSPIRIELKNLRRVDEAIVANEQSIIKLTKKVTYNKIKIEILFLSKLYILKYNVYFYIECS